MREPLELSSHSVEQWRAVTNRLMTMGGAKGVHAGSLSGAANTDGQPIAAYAAANEFGAPGIPFRPFMRTTAREKGNDRAQLFAQRTKGTLASDPAVAKRALTAIGRVAESDIQATIMSNMPPLPPEGAASKKNNHGGHAGALFVSGDMHNAVAFEVVDGTGVTAA